MKIADKLRELRRNVLRDRSGLIAGQQTDDRLWDDQTLLRYIKDGETRFARQTLIIRDAVTIEVTRITLRTGVTTYGLHPSVFGVFSARYSDDQYDLQRSGHSIVNSLRPAEFLTFDPATATTQTPGRPQLVYTDESLVFQNGSRVTLGVYPAPSAAENGDIIYLRVFRGPMNTYTFEKMDAEESEIPEAYELDPLHWAAYRAYSNDDPDGGSTAQANKHKTAFDAAVRNAKRELRRTLFAPMQFQHGTNGHSYTR
jgi:hypothetical protein